MRESTFLYLLKGHFFAVRYAVLGMLITLHGITAQAGLFDDDEARKAILDMRQRYESLRLSTDAAGKKTTEELLRLSEENTQIRRAMLELQTQIELLKQEQAKLRGQDEQLARDLAEVQRHQKDFVGGLEDRLRKVEPTKLTVDGRDFVVEPTERRDYETAFVAFRKGDFTAARTNFSDFIKRNPQSGYLPSALFWLGNAQYALREYKEAIANFRLIVSQYPDHVRASEALLSVANCQSELKDMRATRRTLEELLKAYPSTESAVAGKERLVRLKSS